MATNDSIGAEHNVSGRDSSRADEAPPPRGRRRSHALSEPTIPSGGRLAPPPPLEGEGARGRGAHSGRRGRPREAEPHASVATSPRSSLPPRPLTSPSRGGRSALPSSSQTRGDRPGAALSSSGHPALRRADGALTGWALSRAPAPYLAAVAAMEARAEAIARGEAGELVWLLEHPPLYTAGGRAREEDLLDPRRLPVFRTGRGGQLTYHGPGQRVAYVMLDLGARGRDVRAFVAGLERWLIGALAELGVRGEARADRVGVWVPCEGGREDKIAAIGVRVRRWVSFHGVALNVDPELSHFEGIVPCGVRGHGVTSLAELGATSDMASVDAALRRSYEAVFGPTAGTEAPLA